MAWVSGWVVEIGWDGSGRILAERVSCAAADLRITNEWQTIPA
jgi:hypothetical protein